MSSHWRISKLKHILFLLETQLTIKKYREHRWDEFFAKHPISPEQVIKTVIENIDYCLLIAAADQSGVFSTYVNSTSAKGVPVKAFGTTIVIKGRLMQNELKIGDFMVPESETL